ncbi:MAG: ATP synthase subunit C [Candidatus Bathyarchaeia archaeon]
MFKGGSERILTRRNAALMIPFVIALLVLAFQVAATSGELPAEAPKETPGLGLIAAALAVGLSGLGAGIAIFGSTSAGMAATVERPELTTWVLIFAGLGEGLAIYGLVVAIMILGKI